MSRSKGRRQPMREREGRRERRKRDGERGERRRRRTLPVTATKGQGTTSMASSESRSRSQSKVECVEDKAVVKPRWRRICIQADARDASYDHPGYVVEG